VIGLAGKTFAGAAAICAAAAAVLLTGLQQGAPPAAAPTAAAGGIPAAYLAAYQQGAGRCPGLDWPVLAGIGKVETDHGRSPTLVSSAGALGPMQFLPATWTAYRIDANADGTADVYDIADAAAGAADYLCALGAGADLRGGLIAYNCGNTGPACQLASAVYAARVLVWAGRYATTPAGPGATGQVAVRAAMSQLGTAYVWGGDRPGGFDCSGLTQWAYANAGLALPRTAQQQYDTGNRLPDGATPSAGDLVFFGTGPAAIEHVGLYLGDGRMLDAPHTGADVRIEPVAGFTPPYVGAIRPAGS